MASASDKAYSLVGKNLKLTSEEDIAPYIEEIQAIESLQEIHLGGNTLGVGACQALGKVLEGKKELKVADFADIFTGRLISEIPDALRALCDSLVHHEGLVEMDLSDNAFGGRSAEPMVNFLTHNHHFSVLKLNNNGLGVTGGQIVANALLAAAEELQKQGKPSKLKTVICGRNRLEDGSAPYWAKAYAAHKTLEEVRMFQNGIRMDGVVALSQGLAACPDLRVLDLQDNTATVAGSRGIVASLPRWPQLEVLNLSDCLLKPKGGYLVIDALHKGNNSKLSTLQLQYCDLDRKALQHLASAIDSGALKNVDKLEINGNWADEEDECIENIKKALEKQGHEDALDELDEMDPEGEDEEGEEEEKVEEEDGVEEETAEGKKEEASTSEIAAATVAAPAATAAIAGTAAVTAASGAKEAIDEKLQDLSLKDMPESDDADGAQDPQRANAVTAAEEAEQAIKSKDEDASVAATSAASPQVSAEESNLLAEQKEKAMEPPAVAIEEETPESQAPTVVKDSSVAQPAPAQLDKSTGMKEAEKQDSTFAAIGASGAAAAGAAGAAIASAVGAEPSESKDETPKAESATATQEDTPAESAAQVADSAREVPEEGDAAENAAEVAESAQEVPDDKTAAETADEVDEIAKQVPEKLKGQAAVPVADANETPAITEATQPEVAAAGVGITAGASAAVAIPAAAAAATGQETVAPTAKDVSLSQPSIGSAAQPAVQETAAPAVPSKTGDTDKLADMMGQAKVSEPLPAKAGQGHGKSGSVDLSGELYGDEGTARVSNTAAASTSAQGAQVGGAAQQGQPASASEETKQKRKSGFRAAFGAIRELLR